MTLTLSEIKAGDTIEVRCTGGKRKSCPFSKKTQTGKSRQGQRSTSSRCSSSAT